MRYIFAISLLFVSSILIGCSNFLSVAGAEESSSSSELFYATDRNVLGGDSGGKFFGNKRGELSFGIYKPSLIEENRNDLKLNGGKDDIDRHIVTKPWDDWISEVSVRSKSSTDGSVLVYVHGYAKSFQEASDEASRFSNAIVYQGVPILYSWPSRGSAFGYSSDIATLEWSTFYLKKFLEQLIEDGDIKTVHLVAHSLGVKAVLEAVVKLIEPSDSIGNKPWSLGEIVLIAPDVEKGIFVRDYLPAITNIQSRITLYTSIHDLPLKISEVLNGNQRLGDSRHAPVYFPGVETIDVSPVSSLFRGHSYYRKDPDVISDISLLINQRLGAEARPYLMPKGSTESRSWSLIK